MKRNQSAHTACAWAVRGKRRARVEKMNNCTDINLKEWGAGYKWSTFCVTTIMKRNQSAHTACTWAVRGKRRARVEKMNNCIDIKLQRMRGRFLLSNLIKINNSIACLVSSLCLKRSCFDTNYSFVGFFARDRALRSIQPHSQAAPWGQGTGGLRLLCICAEFKQCFYLPLSPSPPSLPLFLSLSFS